MAPRRKQWVALAEELLATLVVIALLLVVPYLLLSIS